MYSFKTKGELFESTLALPEKFNLNNYTRAWEQLDFIKVLGNSLFITVISIVFIVLFAITNDGNKKSFHIQTVLSIATVIDIGFKSGNIIYLNVCHLLHPSINAASSNINIMGKLNLLNVPGIIFMYIGFGSASAIFLYHGFVKSIPKELDIDWNVTSIEDININNIILLILEFVR